jgi:hypothetical protein
METNAESHSQTELGKSYGIVGRRIKEIGTPQEDQQSTSLHPWGFPETEPPTKQHMWVRPSCPQRYVADGQLGLYEGAPKTGVGAVSGSAVCLIPLTWLPCLASRGENMPNSAVT